MFKINSGFQNFEMRPQNISKIKNNTHTKLSQLNKSYVNQNYEIEAVETTEYDPY